MQVILVKPEKEPEVVEIENTLPALQEAVGGFIEVTYPDKAGGVIICNEEGKLKNLPLNRNVGYDIIVGDFIVCASKDGNFVSLSDKQLAHYMKKFTL